MLEADERLKAKNEWEESVTSVYMIPDSGASQTHEMENFPYAIPLPLIISGPYLEVQKDKGALPEITRLTTA